MIFAVTAVFIVILLVGGLRYGALKRELVARQRIAEPSSNDELSASDEALTQLLLAFDKLRAGVVVVDGDGNEVARNEVATRYQDARHSEALVERALVETLELAQLGDSIDRIVEFSGPPERTVKVRGRPLMRERQQIAAVAIVEDLTESARLDKVRRDFVANLSHELRTPVGAIALLCDTLVGEETTEVRERLAKRISSETERVGHIIDDLFELSRVELDGDLRKEKGDIGALVQEVVDQHEPMSNSSAVHVSYDRPKNAVNVTMNSGQISRAVGNLVDNAIKYSGPGGSVAIAVKEFDDKVDVEVTDNGIGVPRGEFDRIFERFYRVDKARSRATGGTGLGLSIVRHVIANHGGEVLVESNEGEGSVFTLRIPKETDL
ncbi:MAG: sensor histidine kinase [Candidatus Poriferisodalaceae bacterium]